MHHMNAFDSRLTSFRQMTLDAPLFHSQLRADPLYRCVALQLPKDSLAILPFYQSQADLDVMEQEAQTRCAYSSPCKR